MKVLVKTQQQVNELVLGTYSLAERLKATGLINEAAEVERKANDFANFRDSMTSIDIPDGCALAVVDNVLPKLFPPAEVTWNEGYRRVVKEVKL
jgi:hypothetical protein